MDGVVQVEVAVVECGWTSCSCVKKVPKMMTALDLHGRFADCLQAAVADSSFVFFASMCLLCRIPLEGLHMPRVDQGAKHVGSGNSSHVDFQLSRTLTSPWRKRSMSMLRDIARLSLERNRCSRRVLDLCDEERKTRLKN